MNPMTTPNALAAERHPNALTAPPLHRGSMTPLAWRGFWAGLLAWFWALFGYAAAAAPAAWQIANANNATQPWQQAAQRRRLVFLGITLGVTALATTLFAYLQPKQSHLLLQWGQLGLFALLSAWLVTGFTTALMGFWVSLRGDPHALTAASVRHDAMNPAARTAVIMPICNEDVGTVFAGLRATCESLAATGSAAQFDVFVLSDSNQPATIAAERAAWSALREALAAQTGDPQVEVYYRLRKRRVHRKAGNVADFCRRWGKDYRYMVVLDADSVMSGDCLCDMVKLMEANPRAGIVQTATQSIGHVTLHARAQQFASRMTGRLFTLGMQYWQLGESHYWGHNAIIRVEPFMAHCALAKIAGTGGLSGGILSHDFVEAALMRRAGWQVWLVADLVGSYEQQPPDLISELQRDRRWCQGNLQNARLIAEPGLHPLHRTMFATGAMSYLSAPMWLLFLCVGTALWLSGSAPATSIYLFDNFALGLALPPLPAELIGLWALTLVLLLLPRLLGIAAVLLKGEQKQYGGALGLCKSALLETLLALLQSPVRMLAHSLFVLVALTGWKLEWKSPPREALALSWRAAATSLAPMTLVIALLAVLVASVDAQALVWLIPVGLPLLLAVPAAVLMSHIALGTTSRRNGFLLIPEEQAEPVVLRRAWLHAAGAASAPLLAAA